MGNNTIDHDIDYKQFYDRAGSSTGWDFSEIEKRIKVIGKKWDYLRIVRRYINRETVLLDVGTGGGEVLLKVAGYVKKAYGIDCSKSMIRRAKKNLFNSNLKNVEFALSDAKKIPFPNNYFDVVVCRHSNFYPSEVFRVMKPDGIFITQQVDERDKENIKKIFGRGQSFGEKPGSLMKKYIKELELSGFKILKTDTYDATEYYKMDDFVSLLERAPIIQDFDATKDEKFLKEIEKKYGTEEGIMTNSFRFLIVCQKPHKI